MEDFKANPTKTEEIETTAPQQAVDMPSVGLPFAKQPDSGVPSGIMPCSDDGHIPTAGLAGQPESQTEDGAPPSGIEKAW